MNMRTSNNVKITYNHGRHSVIYYRAQYSIFSRNTVEQTDDKIARVNLVQKAMYVFTGCSAKPNYSNCYL